jgi:hypothetical protein
MSTFDYFLCYFLTVAATVWLLKKYRAWKDEKDLRDCYEPHQPNKLQILICKLQHHRRHGQYHIESKGGVSKIKCLGCHTVFLEGRKIKVKMSKL